VPTWDDVLAIARGFPEVEERTAYGTPAIYVRKAFLGRLRTNPDAFVVRVEDVGEQTALLQMDPEVFFTTPHYDGHAYVLVRLEVVSLELLAELVEDAWRLRAPKRVVAAFDAA
jgi:hypothetical protein